MTILIAAAVIALAVYLGLRSVGRAMREVGRADHSLADRQPRGDGRFPL
jgi:hypothetical protein